MSRLGGRERKLWLCDTPITIKEIDGDMYYEGERVFGTFDKYTNMIEIAGEQGEGPWLRTLLHELIHAILANVCGSTKTLPSHEQEEAFVRATEVGLFSLYMDRRNAWFWERMDKWYALED